jgi:formylglycine-generating enzyme required for sulfatase activity
MRAGIMRCYIKVAFFFLGVLTLIQSSSGDSPKAIKTKSGVEMILVPGGAFTMGDKQGDVDEEPHEVYIDSFYIDKYPVTQEEYEKVMGENPSRWKGRKNPVEQVRWSDAVKYCNARSRREGLQPCYDLETWECNFDANGYRLPTEAEWEYACRAGTKTSYSFGDDSKKLRNYAWFKENSSGRPRPVGQKLPNPWGIHDMYGNVFEWCNDFYKVDYYQESPEKNPRGPESGDTKIVRGGSWNSPPDKCRSSYRYNENPGYSDVCFGYDIYGFRCVRNFSPDSATE